MKKHNFKMTNKAKKSESPARKEKTRGNTLGYTDEYIVGWNNCCDAWEEWLKEKEM